MAFLGLFGKPKGLTVARKVVAAVNELEKEFKDKPLSELKAESDALRAEVKNGKTLNELLPRAFALVRETARQTLKQRHFDVQLIGGYVLHTGAIAEMRTGEGKTLSATLPTYLNALQGEGAHVITVNEYLAKRDTVWMGQVYHALGMKVACLVHDGALLYDPEYKNPVASKGKENEDQPLREGGLIDAERDTTGSFLIQDEFLRPISRKEAYEADITHGTNHEFGFDYLRDNLAYRLEDQVQRRGHHFAIIDEVDSVLIDEARTPLIIAAPDRESSEFYKKFSHVVRGLTPETDYVVDEKQKAVSITQEGIDKVEKAAGIADLFGPQNIRLVHYMQECLRAHAVFKRDKDYVVKDGEIVIVDQFTGRMMQGRRYSGGLHQAIEAKEGVAVRQESRTYAQISIQNYFRLYKKLAGMTGTAQTSAEEFHKVYNLEVITIPTNRDMVRKDLPDVIYKTKTAKYKAIVDEVKKRTEAGQPVLIGTVSIEKNEELGRQLSLAGVRHEVLNAKNNEREGAIIAQAGKPAGVTVATNMAGRGVDIILGGNPPKKEDAEKVRSSGGLHVIGTERHESRRIDNQLRGRAGRQGDPGSSQFFLSMEDDLMRIFGGERLKGLMERLNIPDEMPITAAILTRSVAQAQSRVEGHNFDARKHLLEYDDVLNKQRLVIYKKRQEMLAGTTHPQMLSMLDTLWMTHLENMEALQESVRLRAYAQHDPLVEYRREGHRMFQDMLAEYDKWLAENEEKLKAAAADPNKKEEAKSLLNVPEFGKPSNDPKFKDAQRNDPCPCGSGKKFKKCHGK